MPDIDTVVKGLGLAALHLHNIAQRGGSLFKAMIPYDSECCVDAIELLKAQESQIRDLQKVQPWIVRCKDCRNWTKALGGQCNRFTVNDIAHCTSPDWFCADGERK